MFGNKSQPTITPPALPDPLPSPPQFTSPGTKPAGKTGGAFSSIMTSPSGVEDQPGTAKTSLLGQ